MTELQLEQWIKRYNTENTRASAVTAYNILNRYLELREISMQDWISALRNEESKYEALGDFVRSLDTMPASTRKFFSFIKNYIRVIHQIKTDNEEIKDFIKFKPILKITREPLTKEKIKTVCQNSNPSMKALWLVLSSSGMRISEALNLKPENYDFNKKPVIVTIPANITKTKTERITCISQEAKKSILESEFFKIGKLNTIEKYFSRVRLNCNLIDRYEGTRNYKFNIHAFRSFFRTKAGEINQDFAEDMIGHSGYLRQYVRIPKETKIEYYSQLEKKLKIF